MLNKIWRVICVPLAVVTVLTAPIWVFVIFGFPMNVVTIVTGNPIPVLAQIVFIIVIGQVHRS